MAQIKGIIFDLDDTLFDCTGTLALNALRRCAEAMISAGFVGCDSTQLIEYITSYFAGYSVKSEALLSLCSSFDIKPSVRDDIIKAGLLAYNDPKIDSEIHLFDGVRDLLHRLSADYRLFLVTDGLVVRQKNKIASLGISDFFTDIFINDIPDYSKEQFFSKIMRDFSFEANELVVVGDRLDSEIRAANSLGMHSVRFLFGRHLARQPLNDLEVPDFSLVNLPSLPVVLALLSISPSQPKIVCLGGGTGMPNVLRGLRHYTRNLTAVVGVTDSGRSSGILRKEFSILPPGDIRNCLVALADDTSFDMSSLFSHRFSQGSLAGHSLGNLILAGLSEQYGNFSTALEHVGRLLRIRGSILPVSLDDCVLCARRSDGTTAIGEDSIVQRFADAATAPRIDSLFLEQSRRANVAAVESILQADCVVIGPGSLFTSVLPNLLFAEITDAIARSHAVVIYVANLMTQPFQTDGFSLSDHVRTVNNYLGGSIDFVLTSSRLPSAETLDAYAREGSFLVKQDVEETERLDCSVISCDLLVDGARKEEQYNKRDSLKHDSRKVADAILKVLAEARHEE